MIFLSILILIVAIALPFIIKNISSNLYVRISSIIFIYAGALALLYACYIQSIGSGIGIYSGLFQFSAVSQLIEPLFNLTNAQLIIFRKILLLLFWFAISIYTYLNYYQQILKG